MAYDALDEHNVRQVSDACWAKLVAGPIHFHDLKHNERVSLLKMGLIVATKARHYTLTPQGRQYAQLVLAPPF